MLSVFLEQKSNISYIYIKTMSYSKKKQ